MPSPPVYHSNGMNEDASLELCSWFLCTNNNNNHALNAAHSSSTQELREDHARPAEIATREQSDNHVQPSESAIPENTASESAVGTARASLSRNEHAVLSNNAMSPEIIDSSQSTQARVLRDDWQSLIHALGHRRLTVVQRFSPHMNTASNPFFVNAFVMENEHYHDDPVGITQAVHIYPHQDQSLAPPPYMERFIYAPPHIDLPLHSRTTAAGINPDGNGGAADQTRQRQKWWNDDAECCCIVM